MTLTIDDDLAVQLEEARRRRRTSLKTIVNEALRRGVAELGRPRRGPLQSFRSRTFNMGESLVGELDNIADVLSAVEGETFK